MSNSPPAAETRRQSMSLPTRLPDGAFSYLGVPPLPENRGHFVPAICRPSEATAKSERGNHATPSTRRSGYPSPKIAAASRQRFVGPPARGGLGGVCGSAFHFWNLRISSLRVQTI